MCRGRDARTRHRDTGVGALSMPGQFTGAVADQYMNPYLDTVLDRQKTAAIRDLTEQVQLGQQTQ